MTATKIEAKSGTHTHTRTSIMHDQLVRGHRICTVSNAMWLSLTKFRAPYPNPTHYYVHIRPDSTPWPNCSGNTHCFKLVSNSTDITFTHLNASKMYYVKMGAYHRCSGIAVEDSVWGMDAGKLHFVFMQPSANLTNDTLAEGDPTADPPVGKTQDSFWSLMWRA